MSTIFGKIIAGELPAEKVFENERFIAIKDIAPKAPVHLLIIPKKEVANFQEIEKTDLQFLSEAAEIAQKLAEEFGVEKGYRFLTNIGSDAGQTVFHLHFHLIGGKTLGDIA
ncbi:MAG: histidine triad nucleotide-binding protein [Candidatus Algichlamydia australiensis]|nr:histidine triad nucleotide-binding protein [Chlamydiales bacterium]